MDEATSTTWKDHLDNPYYRNQLEICRTHPCGILVLAALKEDVIMSQHNVNVTDLWVQVGAEKNLKLLP